jgi:hypothetical protein
MRCGGLAHLPQTGNARVTHVLRKGYARATSFSCGSHARAVRVSRSSLSRLIEALRMNDVPIDDLRPIAATFRKSAGHKMEAVLPHQNAVRELRGKGASFALIARLLVRIGVHVSTDTLRRLCARPPSDACDAPPVEQSTSLPEPAPKAPTVPAFTPHKPRGPRIADPSTQ